MKQKLTLFQFCALLAVAASLVGCGGGNSGSGNNGSGSGSGTSNTTGYPFGQRLGVTVNMQPSPSSYSFPPWSGTAPGIRIDQVVPFSATVNPGGTSINQPTTQLVYGQVTGSTSGVAVVVYAYTNSYYVQPLTGTTITVASDSTWIAPANAGQITVLLVRQGYSAPDAP